LAAASGTKDIAARYATAFFALAQEKNAVPAVEKDIKILQQMGGSADMRRFLRNPTLTRAEQAKGLLALAAHFGVSDLTAKLLGVMAQRRRLPAFDSIVAEIDALIASSKGETTAHVTSAQALDPAQLEQLATALKKTVGVNHVRIDLSIDPEILGGLVVRLGSKQIDSSVRSKLDRLTRALKNPQNSTDKNKMKEVA
jgi:F-type H+-transporting ATPase subunit delta